MVNIQEFLQQDAGTHLAKLTEDTAADWGIMTPQHMVEHLILVLKVSLEKIPVTLAIPEKYLPKQKAFLMSDRKFKQNLKAPGIPACSLLPLHYENLSNAKKELFKVIEAFYAFFEKQATKTTMHPAFGQLNKEEWEQFHYKHFQHHFTQFQLLR